MQIISWLIFGLIVGAIAKLLFPGNERMGCLSTIALGILGSVMGGVIAKFLWNVNRPVEPAGWILSIVGAVLVLAIVTWTSRRRLS
jgi:uncharacterized membrane protein YeaQ/YmgE (transglycosylase-associated protein family)